ncbi:MAG: dihydroorotase [Lachnospiraceae bacterium]|nr:dihydroorotase [Lachnospiraceae bacterium]
MKLIQGGTVVDPCKGTMYRKDILIKDGKIAEISEKIDASDYGKEVQIIDASGKKIGPGLVDVHVHFRDPGFTYKEDIETGALSAAKGGFTAVVLMANTKPTVDNEETLAYVLEKGEKTAIHVHTCAAITKSLQGETMTDMEGLKDAGAVGFTDDGIPILSEELVRAAMEKAAKLDVPLSFHEEDPSFIDNNGINRGKASAHFGIGGSDRMAEISLVERDLEIALSTGAAFNVQHISAKESVELVRKAKKKASELGQSNIHAEATPHHFTLTEEAAVKYGTLAKMNPPLREEADRMAVIEGLADGTIDLIATDHAPHSSEEKERPITEAPSGIIGLETAFALAVTNLVKPGYLTLTQLFDRMSLAPAKMYHLPYGNLEVGKDADMIIFDDEKEITFDRFVSKSSNSPFLGQTFYGTIEMTICKGEIAYAEKQ